MLLFEENVYVQQEDIMGWLASSSRPTPSNPEPQLYVSGQFPDVECCFSLSCGHGNTALERFTGVRYELSRGDKGKKTI